MHHQVVEFLSGIRARKTSVQQVELTGCDLEIQKVLVLFCVASLEVKHT